MVIPFLACTCCSYGYSSHSANEWVGMWSFESSRIVNSPCRRGESVLSIQSNYNTLMMSVYIYKSVCVCLWKLSSDSHLRRWYLMYYTLHKTIVRQSNRNVWREQLDPTHLLFAFVYVCLSMRMRENLLVIISPTFDESSSCSFLLF